MGVSLSEKGLVAAKQRGARARTRKLMLETATALMQKGITPSVSDVAEAAEVSRATAYRYFPSQAALVTAVVDEGLGPILTWHSEAQDAEERVADLLSTSMPRIVEFESTFKAALKLSLEQWARRQAGTLGEEPAFKRGHRIELLQLAIAPLRKTMPKKQFERLAQALSLVYGLEVLIVLKDLWGLEFEQTRSVALWTAHALVRTAVAEAAQPKPARRAKGGKSG